MSQLTTSTNKVSDFFTLLKQAIRGDEMDYTSGSIRKAVFMLAIPMMLEMMMESVFAVVDLYFVGHLENSSHAIQTVGLTESVLTIIYSLAIGMSMAATAVVARRVGEKNPEAAAHAGVQSIVVASLLLLLLALSVSYLQGICLAHGCSDEETVNRDSFVRIMMGGSLVIMLLFLINGIFRGAGNAAMAMKSLWLANICNIIFCPIFINGLGTYTCFWINRRRNGDYDGRGIGVCISYIIC